MTDYTKVYNGISKVFWAHFFLFFNFSINIGGVSISIIPSFISYIFFFGAIQLLKDEERELSLLKPLCTILGIWVAIQWLASCVGYSFGGKWQFLTLIHGLLGLYFNFQFITNLASIATKHQKEGCDYDKKLLKYRTIEVIVQSVFLIYTNLTFLSTEVLLGISSVVGIVSFIINLYVIVILNALKKNLKTVDENADDNSIEISEI